MSGSDEPSAHRTLERVARESYGRLVSLLAARWRDIEAAEDALSEALAVALERWPASGIPANPEGWLVRVARNRLLDRHRRSRLADRIREGQQEALARDAATEVASVEELVLEERIPDERLALLFVVAHPALDESVRGPLMLQTVLGMTAEQIGSLYLRSPAAIGQRLARAKRKIREAGIGFAAPEPAQRTARLPYVLDAIYGAYTAGWAGRDERSRGGATEALWLAELLASLVPDDPEALGLHALLLYVEARAGARTDADGCYVPLDEQDEALWDREMIKRAEAAMLRARRMHTVGRYQIEAAIQSAHCARAFGPPARPDDVTRLYEALLHVAPSIGAAVAYASALSRSVGPEQALGVLAEWADGAQSYQPYWAARADLLALAGRNREAAVAYGKAIALCDDPAVQAFLRNRAGRLEGR